MKIDLLCDDYKSAAHNRRMVRLKQNISEYIRIENLVRSWPHNKPLPNWITQGNLPKIGKVSNRTLQQYGFYKVIDERIDITAVKDGTDGLDDDWNGSWDNAVKIFEEKRQT